jgi:broad specificity phosphatase PhoE
MRLLLMTHAETDWNAQGRFQGHAGSSLNVRGRQQAEGLQQRLAHEKLQAIIASDLPRAWETAQIVAVPHALTVKPEPRLRELHFGAWEGLTLAEIQERDPDALSAWQADPSAIGPPGGETLANLAQRLQSFLDELAGHAESVLLVGHRGSMRVLLCLLQGLDVRAHWQFRLEVASVTQVFV